MKKILFISMMSCIVLTLHAQKIPVNSKPVQTTKQLQPTMQQQTKVTPQTRTNISQQVNNIRMFPIPDKIHFLSFRKSLLKNGIQSRPIMQNRATYTNTSSKNILDTRIMNGNSNVKNVMDKKTTKSNLNTRLNSSIQKISLMHTVTKILDGHKVSFTLTDDRSNWANDFAFARKVKDSIADHSDPKWDCASVTLSVDAQSSSFMNASVNQNGTSLIPGTIYTFDDYANGNFREYRDGRNPVVVWTPTNVGKDSFNVQNPNGQTLSQGISNIISQFSQTQGGAAAYEHTIFSNNLSDLNMLVSPGGSYSGFSGFGITKVNQSQHHVYVTYDAIKPLYTIIVQPPSNGYFADGKTPATSSPLVVVQNVTYGTRLLANIDIQTSTFTNYDSLHLAYTDGVDNAALDFSMLANNKSLTYTGNLMVVGTGINIPIISGQNYQQQISDLLAQGNYRTAMPIQYQLTDLDGNVLGVYSMTDQFTVPECTPANEIFYLQSVIASISTGNDGKNSTSHFTLQVGPGTPNNYKLIGTFYDNSTEYKHENGIVTVPITFPSNAPENSYTWDDFNNGGVIYLALGINQNSGLLDPVRDDWDIDQLKVTFIFKSQKNTVRQYQVLIPKFRMSDPDRPSATFYFDAGFHLSQ